MKLLRLNALRRCRAATSVPLMPLGVAKPRMSNDRKPSCFMIFTNSSKLGTKWA